MAVERYTTAEVIEAIRVAKGIKMTAARHLGCTWWTVNNYCKRHPTVQKAYEETRQELIDLAESKLRQKVEKGADWAIKWVLATLGKDRGWVERKEVTGAEGGPVRWKIEEVDDWRAGENGDQTDL